jgi:hypothetical protein
MDSNILEGNIMVSHLLVTLLSCCNVLHNQVWAKIHHFALRIEGIQANMNSASISSGLKKPPCFTLMQYFIGRLLVVVQNSGHEARDNLLVSPDVAYSVRVPFSLLSKQLKHVYLFWLEE